MTERSGLFFVLTSRTPGRRSSGIDPSHSASGGRFLDVRVLDRGTRSEEGVRDTGAEAYGLQTVATVRNPDLGIRRAMACAFCGGELTSRWGFDPRKRFCSASCRASAAYRAKAVRSSGPCSHCGRPFSSRYWKLPKSCSPSCRSAAAAARRRRACDRCGVTFARNERSSRFCSRACYVAARRAPAAEFPSGQSPKAHIAS